jgi:hypothetical protein
MTDIALTAAQVSLAFPNAQTNEIVDFIATEAITKGQAVYLLTTGKVGVADANASGKQQFRGIALANAAAGKPVSVLKKGVLYGYTISGLNADAMVYLSDTAGALADAAGTMTVVCGRVISLTDPSLTKVLYVDADWLRAWS